MREEWSESGQWDLPDGRSFRGWSSGNGQEGKYSYFWFSPDDSQGRQPEVWYRTYPVGRSESRWEIMVSSDEVFAKTGHVSGSDDDSVAPVLGGAEKLEVGTYHLDFRVVMDGEPLLLRGVTFQVGSWQIRPGMTTMTEVGEDDPDLHAIVQVLRNWSEREALIEEAFSEYRAIVDAEMRDVAERLKEVKPEFVEQHLVFRAAHEGEGGPFVITRLSLTTYCGLDDCGHFSRSTPINGGRSSNFLTLDYNKLPRAGAMGDRPDDSGPSGPDGVSS
jgi:hypothetical protein